MGRCYGILSERLENLQIWVSVRVLKPYMLPAHIYL